MTNDLKIDFSDVQELIDDTKTEISELEESIEFLIDSINLIKEQKSPFVMENLEDELKAFKDSLNDFSIDGVNNTIANIEASLVEFEGIDNQGATTVVNKE